MQLPLSSQLAKRLREVFLDGKWIANTNYKEQLELTDFKVATTQVKELNTVGMLTFHIRYYLQGVQEVLDGGPLAISDRYSFDMPPLTSEHAWQDLRSSFISAATIFADTVENIPEVKWDQPFVSEEYGSYRHNIEGLLEHSYYHLGQIVLMRKLVRNNLLWNVRFQVIGF